MSSERLNPADLYNSVRFGFSHAAIDTRNGIVHLAGQVGWDKDYAVAAGDLAAQTRQALANIAAVLAEAGCGAADLLRIRTYIVDHDVAKLGIVSGELSAFYGDVTPAPNTIVGVSALALPDFLVEIEAEALLPRH